MTAASEHVLTVTYTIDDDGIHLSCSCGKDISCGFNPSPSELVIREQQHRLEENTR